MKIFISLIFLATSSFASASANSPTEQEIFGALMDQNAIALPKDKGCEHKNIKTYLAFLMGTLAKANGSAQTQGITSTCEDPTGAPLPLPKVKEKYWDCQVTFRTVDKNSQDPWAYGLTFRMDRASKKIKKSPIFCHGGA